VPAPPVCPEASLTQHLHYLAKCGVAERSYGGAMAADAVNMMTEPHTEPKRATLRVAGTARLRGAEDAVRGAEIF